MCLSRLEQVTAVSEDGVVVVMKVVTTTETIIAQKE